MRVVLISAMLGTQALALVNAAWQGRDLRRFLDATPRLDSTSDLERFKGLAARQMWAALVQGALLLVAPACFVFGVFDKHLTGADFVWILLPSLIVILTARSYRSLELRAWTLESADSELEAARDAVVRTWRTRPLPDW
jgi:hypothetical protein